MPNCFAHAYFGELVLARIPHALRERLKEEKTAYEIGLFGADPLFFGPSRARKIGHHIHSSLIEQTLTALRRAAFAGQPFAAGYGAGFFCHFALDHRVHSLIRELLSREAITHVGVEGELDRLIAEKRGRGFQMPSLRDLPDGFYRTVLENAYPGVSREVFQKSFRNFRVVSWAYLGVVFGSIWNHTVRGNYRDYHERLADLFDTTVEETAEQMVCFFTEGARYDRGLFLQEHVEGAVT